MSGKNNGEDCNEDSECESKNCYNNTICVSEEGFRYLDYNDKLENARQNKVDDLKLARLEAAVKHSEEGKGKTDIDEIGGREGIKQKIENKKQKKREQNHSDAIKERAARYRSHKNEDNSSLEQAPGGGRRVEVHHVKNDDGSREKVTIVREPENTEPIMESNSPFDIEKIERLRRELQDETDENIIKSKNDAIIREEDKVSPIGDNENINEAIQAAMGNRNLGEIKRLHIKKKKREQGRDKKKSAESDTVRPADQVIQEILDDGSRGNCLLCQKPVFPDNMNVCPTDNTNHIYHKECFQEILLRGDNRCIVCRSIFDRDDIQEVERIVRIKTCPPADRHLIDERLHELIQTNDEPAKHVNPHTDTEELYSDIFTDNDDVNRRKHEIHTSHDGTGYPITLTVQDNSTLFLCYETQQVSILGCQGCHQDIPYRVRLDDYVELINEVRNGRLTYYILEDGTDFLLFTGDTDRIDNRIDPRLYANQLNSIDNFIAFFNNLEREQRQQPQNNLPIPRQQQLIADGLERIGRPDFEFRDPEMAQTFANVENIMRRLHQPQQGNNQRRPPRVRVRRGRRQQTLPPLQQTLQPQQQTLEPLRYQSVGRDYVNAFIREIGGVPTPENPYIFHDGRRLIGFQHGFGDLYTPVYELSDDPLLGGKNKTTRKIKKRNVNRKIKKNRRKTMKRGGGGDDDLDSIAGTLSIKRIKPGKGIFSLNRKDLRKFMKEVSKSRKSLPKQEINIILEESHNTTRKNKTANKKGRNVNISEQNNKIQMIETRKEMQGK